MTNWANHVQTNATNLINSNNLGNSATLYSYGSATKTENDEGDITVSSWTSGSSIKYIPGDQSEKAMIFARHIAETNAETQIIVPSSTTIDIKDRLLLNSNNYQVNEVNEAVISDVVVFKIIGINLATDTTLWA